MLRSLRHTTVSRALKKHSPNAFFFSETHNRYTSRVPFSARNMNTLQEASRIYKAFQKGGPSFGGWQVGTAGDACIGYCDTADTPQMLPGTNLARAIARSGVDWICVDTEHGNINDSQMHEAVTAIALAGVSPIVRIAANELWMVKRTSTP